MSKPVKEMMMSQIKQRLEGTRDFVVVDASKLDANTNNQLRIDLRKEGVQMLAVKNALAQRVLKAEEIEAPSEVFNGPCTIVWGASDIVSLAKLTTKKAKELEPLEIRGGAIDGAALDPAGVDTWSKAKGRDETIAEIVGALLGPGMTVCGALKGPAGVVAGCVKAQSDEESRQEVGG